MKHTILWFIAAMGGGGFVLGWLVSGSRTQQARVSPAPAIHHSSPSLDLPSALTHRFPLTPADVGADRETPAIAVDSAGRIVVAWASQSGPSERTLYLTRSTDGGKSFDPPAAWRKVPIYFFPSRSESKSKTSSKPRKSSGSSTGKKAMVFSTHVLPRLVAVQDALYLGWVEAIDGGPVVRYLVARSTDAGRTFSEPVPVHGSEAGKPGFTALSLGADGTLCAAWLDSREQSPHPFASEKPDLSDGFAAERLVFAGPEGKGVCPCCDVAVARAADGTSFVAFRNSDSGFRDIWLSRRSAVGDAPFEPPMPIAADRWPFQGCPHDAPSLALRGDRIHAVWMDAHAGRPRVYAASSPLAPLRFETRELSPATKGSQGHPRMIADSRGALLAVWDESLDPAKPAKTEKHEGHDHGAPRTGSGRAIMFSAANSDGTFQPATAVAPRPGAFQLNPAIAAGRSADVYVAWNELDERGKTIVIARLATLAAKP